MKYICESGSNTELLSHESKFYMETSATLYIPWLRMVSFTAFYKLFVNFFFFFSSHLIEIF